MVRSVAQLSDQIDAPKRIGRKRRKCRRPRDSEDRAG
jgi:hypothetical protein